MDKASIRTSARLNTEKEETLLEYVEDFRRQFVQVFPQRAPLFLCPVNEVNTRKFVCSYIRPTQLPFANMYDMADIAEFVADYIAYIKADQPTELPTTLPSPATTMHLRAGDSFDMSQLLVCFLRGAGYDAYVVSGCAADWICENDQTQCLSPYVYKHKRVNNLLPMLDSKMRAHERWLLEQKKRKKKKKKKKKNGNGEDDVEGDDDGDDDELDSDADDDFDAAAATVAAADATVDAANAKAAAAGGNGAKDAAAMALNGGVSSTGGAGAGATTSIADEAAAMEAKMRERVAARRKARGETDKGKAAAAAAAAAKHKEQTYNIRARPSHASQYIYIRQHEQTWKEEVVAAAAAEAAERDARIVTDSLHGHRVHAWVLVRAGKRGVTDSVFIESTTGTVYPVKGGVSRMHTNTYANSTSPFSANENSSSLHPPPLAVLDKAARAAAAKAVDAADGDSQPLLANLAPLEPAAAAAAAAAVDDNAAAARPSSSSISSSSRSSSFLSSPSLSSSSSSSEATPPSRRSPYVSIQSIWNERNYYANVQDCALDDYEYDVSDSRAWEYVLIRERSRLDRDTALEAAFDTVNDSQAQVAPEHDALDRRAILDATCSWTPSIQLSKSQLRQRYPDSRKRIVYYKCTVEKLSEYEDTVHGLVMKIVEYEDEARTVPVEIQEHFAHRKDKLSHRIIYPEEGRVYEHYHPGRTSGLQSFVQVGRRQRVFDFYEHSRVDGLVQREEIVGRKVIERFKHRDDKLSYRSVCVRWDWTPEVEAAEAAQRAGAPGFGLVMLSLAGLPERPITKITEKFSRDRTLPAGDDVAKRTHFLTDGQIRLEYHFNDNHITHSVEIFDKAPPGDDASKKRAEDARVRGLRSREAERERDAERRRERERKRERLAAARSGARALERDRRVEKGWKPLNERQRKQRLHELVHKEKEAMTTIKDRETHLFKLLQRMMRDRQGVFLDRDIYDVAHELAKEKEHEREAKTDDAAAQEYDYLSPFLQQFQHAPGKPLTQRQALQAKDECLLALKKRLLERANIIQQHLNDENEKLTQRQALFKRQAGTGADLTAEFTQYYEEAAFRIDILRARLGHHEEKALKKYLDLDTKLREDPRLAILHQREEI
jgi:hypothetical protein